jgi:nucleoside phosphorylase
MATEDRKKFGIVTVIPEAEKAVRRVFQLNEYRRRYGRTYYYGELPGKADARAIEVVTARCAARSNIPAAVLTTEFLIEERPDYLLLIDIGGGVAEKKKTHDSVNLGDVIVHENLNYYEFSKLTGGEAKERRFPIEGPSADLLRSADVIRSDDTPPWWEDIKEARPVNDGDRPKVLIGEILCGEKLLGDPDAPMLKELLDRFDNTLAVDMESVGVARAVQECRTRSNIRFIVIRGISDYCNERGNQETREQWRVYAASAAAAFGHALVRVETESPAADTLLKRYLVDWSAARKGLRLPSTDFGLTITAGDKSYSDALSLINATPRALLQGPAGAGKTVEVLRAIAAGLDGAYVPVLISLKDVDPLHLEALIAADPPPSLSEKLDVLLAASPVHTSTAVLRTLPKDRRQLLFVDGLNELYGERQVDWIFDVLNAYLDDVENGAVLVTDRPAQRRNLSGEWTIAKLNPVALEVVQEQLNIQNLATLTRAEQALLSTPFFLNESVIGGSTEFATASNALSAFFSKQLAVSETDLNLLSEAAWDAYGTDRSRTFRYLPFAETIGKALDEKLRTADVLTQLGGGLAQFRHQLHHDFLAARYLARQPNLWRDEALDALTFEGVSLSTLNLVIEQLPDELSGDKFIESVYDWSWSGAIQITAHAAAMTPRRCSDEMELTITSLIAEKKVDNVRHTRARAYLGLDEFSSPIAKEIHALPFPAVIERVRNTKSTTAWFLEWQRLFSAEPTADLHPNITTQNPILGWAAANSLRRAPLSNETAAFIVELVRHSTGSEVTARSIRWRAAHILGRAQQPEALDALFTMAESDEYTWARYGAGRSIMEGAALTHDAKGRMAIIDRLVAATPRLDGKVLLEAGQAILYRGAPETWVQEVRPFVNAAKERAQGEAQKRWAEIEERLAEEDEWRISKST